MSQKECRSEERAGKKAYKNPAIKRGIPLQDFASQYCMYTGPAAVEKFLPNPPPELNSKTFIIDVNE